MKSQKYIPNPNQRENTQDGLFRLSQKVALYDPARNAFLILVEQESERKSLEHAGEPWDLPGGHLMRDEDPEIGLRRELQEELGDEVWYELAGVADFLLQNSGYIVYLAVYRGGDITVGRGCEGYLWKTAQEVEETELVHPLLGQAIRSAALRLKEREYLSETSRRYL